MIEQLATEQRNAISMNIHAVSTAEMVRIMNESDHGVAKAIGLVLPAIAEAIDVAAAQFGAGGRLITVGAGTSGRLGMLDCIELTPTYGVPPERAFGIMAGGQAAMFGAAEGAEDSVQAGAADLEAVRLTAQDVVVGLTASGRTPYVLAALKYAKAIGARTISIACHAPSDAGKLSDIGIDVVTGAEVVTGSTRMKAGSAQKMVLNMLSTGIMIKTGKVYQNLMINVQATNEKLVNRGIRIVMEATGAAQQTAQQTFEAADKQVNIAILMLELNISAQAARDLLREKDGNIAGVIAQHAKN